MPASKVRADYASLSQIAAEFGNAASSMRQMLSQLKRQKDILQGKGWVGQGADAFYQEMDSSVLPTLSRLIRALETAQRSTTQINEVMQRAEDEAAAFFRAAASDAASGGGAAATTEPRKLERLGRGEMIDTESGAPPGGHSPGRADGNLYGDVSREQKTRDPDEEARDAFKVAHSMAKILGLPTMVLFQTEDKYTIHHSKRDKDSTWNALLSRDFYLTEKTIDELNRMNAPANKFMPGVVPEGLSALYEEAAHATLEIMTSTRYGDELFEKFKAAGEAEYAGAKLRDGSTTTDPVRLFDEVVGEYVGYRVQSWYEAYEKLDQLRLKKTMTAKAVAEISEAYDRHMRERTFGYSVENGVEVHTSQPMSDATKQFIDAHFLEARVPDRFKSDATFNRLIRNNCKDCPTP
jgi:WXG100 family type VII secretion target